MNAQQEIDWGHLVPEFSAKLLDSQFTTSDLSAWIIGTMLLIAFGALVFVAFKSAKSLSSLRFLRRLLANATQETLARERRDLRLSANDRPYEGALWTEFDETFVESFDGKHLFNTVDAAYFFNTHNLARGVTESRLIAALPGILTAMGVFGTFVGLQLGLSKININDPSQFDESIKLMINGAAVAFSTSVWGVGTSMLFNLAEKAVEQLLRSRILRLQRTIDSLFPRKSAEQTLVNIEYSNAQAETALKGLAEQIGTQMHRAVKDVGASVKTGIQEAIGPGIDSLVRAAADLSSRQENGSERALTSLVDKFTKSVGQMGDEQKQGLERLATEVQASLNGWVGSLATFTGELESKANEWSTTESRREEAFQANMALLTKHQRKTTEEVDGVLSTNLESSQQLANQNLQVSGALEALSQKLEQTSQNLQVVSERFGSLGTDITGATQHLAVAQTDSATAVESAATSNRQVTDSITALVTQVHEIRRVMQNVGETLQESAAVASTAFSSLTSSQSEFLEGMEHHLGSFGEMVNNMLVDYSERVNGQTIERLNTWNKQTQEFLSSMVDAVSTINDVASEMEGHLQARPAR